MANFKLKKGFDIPVSGAAEKKWSEALSPQRVALQPYEFRGIKARLEVAVGDVVKKGSSLFHAKMYPDMKFTSPVSGKVVEINRGPRRMLMEIVVENDNKKEALSFDKIAPDKITQTDREKLVGLLMSGGLWPMLRQRPFNKLAHPSEFPRDIFISGMDTAPLAADMAMIMDGQKENFQAGINCLGQLTDGKVYLSTSAEGPTVDAFAGVSGVELNTFSGPHPAGNVGVQIHHIKPINSGETVWYIAPHDVAMFGKFLISGEVPVERVVALAGNALKDRSYFKTILGAPVAEFVKSEMLAADEVRYINGNVLSGTKILSKGYVGFYNNLLSVIPEGEKTLKFLGWYRPGTNVPSHSRTFFSKLMGKKDLPMSTLLNGAERALIMSGDYESVLPMDIYPVHLVKSVLAEDITEMEGLGILEVDEEDLALCSYICPSKFDFGATVRHGLDMLEKEG